MTTLHMAIPVAAAAVDTPEAQEARWIAWKSKGAAADRITQRRARMAFTAILLALALTLRLVPTDRGDRPLTPVSITSIDVQRV